MFAIIQAGGKQYSVKPGDVIQVNKLEGQVGDKISLGQALFTGGSKPAMGGSEISAEIVSQERGEKVIIFKKKRRQNYRRKNGHRQHLTTLKIGDIKA